MRQYLLLLSGIIFCVQIYWIAYVEPPKDTLDIPFSQVPEFNLPSLDIAGININKSDITNQNIRVINFFASWCAPCRVEHPYLLELASHDVDMLGIAYQDKEELAKKFLIDTDNPYLLTALDQNGVLGREWGISSIPQTFILDENGTIIYHKSGRLKRGDMDSDILPLLKRN